MHRNVVALADEEYDAVAAPLVARACELVARLGATRAYLLPVVISVLQRYVEPPARDQAKAPARLGRPHLRIHLPE